MKPYFSVIIPVYNEESNLEPLWSKLQPVMLGLKKPWEAIFVNDGSRDRSEEILLRLSARQPNLKLISFTRNFGQTAAFAAGIDQAKGEILISLDADLQNDPQDIPRLLKTMKKQKADIVCGWRQKRQDPYFRSLVSLLANRLITGPQYAKLHDIGCSLRIYKKAAVARLKLYGEMHRFLPLLAMSEGAKVVEIPVHHHSRCFGRSKYGFIRTFKVLLDLVTLKFLTDFQTKPIYLFGLAGFSFIFLSGVVGLWIVARKFFLGGDWISPLLFIMTLFFNVGVVCILMGLLAEIQIRTWYESSGKKSYIIKNLIPKFREKIKN